MIFLTRYLATILLALVLTRASAPQVDVNMTATWQGASVARVAWSQPAAVALTCLYRTPVKASAILVTCWYDLASQRMYTLLGNSANTDAAYRPQAGDVYVLTFDDSSVASAALRATVRFPMVTR